MLWLKLAAPNLFEYEFGVISIGDARVDVYSEEDLAYYLNEPNGKNPLDGPSLTFRSTQQTEQDQPLEEVQHSRS